MVATDVPSTTTLRFLETVLDALPAVVFVKDRDFRFLLVNSAWERFTGVPRAEALGKTADALFGPEIALLMRRADESTFETGGCTESEQEIPHRDGARHYLTSRCALHDEGGALSGLVAVATDVTERNRAVAALQQSVTEQRQLVQRLESSERRLVAAQAVAKVGSWEMETSTGVLTWSEEIYRIFEWNPEVPLTCECVIAMAHDDDRDRVAEMFMRTTNLSSPRVTEYRVSVSDGRTKSIEARWRNVTEPDGTQRAVGTCQDITDRKRAELAAAQSDERLASVFQSHLLAVGIYELASGRLVDVSERCAEFFGYSREEMIGRTASELGLWGDPDARASLVAAAVGGRKAATTETTLRRKSGEMRHALVSMESVAMAGIPEPLVMVVLIDTTHRRHLEAQLLQAQKMEAVGRLAGGIAHDFNNTLGVVLGHTELLLRQASEPQRGRLTEILNASQRAAGLTRQLLAFSRRQIVDPRVVDVNDLLENLETMLGRLLGEDVDVAILPGADLGRVMVDPVQLEQVVLNLCVNARDAMPRGGLLRVETTNVDLDGGHSAHDGPMQAGRYVKLAVSDTGVGIEKDILANIFEPFFTTKPVDKGTGLGLAMVYGVVKQAGGYVWVYSEVGCGTTFKVYLPRVDEPLAVLPPPDVTPLPRGTETILLVEDEPSLRDIAREILEEDGYRVLAAGGAAEALELARRHAAPIALLVTDVVMPGMNGRVLAATLAATRPEMKRLFMSGYTDDVIGRLGILEVDTLLVEKPFSARDLLGRVRAALDS